MFKVGWITFHRWLFEDEQSADDLTVHAPSDVVWWHCGPDSPLGRDGFRTGTGRSWAGAGFFENRAKAEHVLDDVSSQFPNLPGWVEEFHCLLRPIRFSGVCHWLAHADAELAVAADDPGGPLAVLTSAGYDAVGPAIDARSRDFGVNVDRVRAWYDTLEGNIVNGNFATGSDDGMTFSLWRSDEDMRAAAYGQGFHRTQLDRQKAERMADRTSYTRTRMLRQFGTWHGRDPVTAVRR